MGRAWQWLLPATFALGCEQLLGVDEYVTDDGEGTVTSSSTSGGSSTGGAPGAGGAGGAGGEGVVAGGPECYHGELTKYLADGYEIRGYQDRCTLAQVDELDGCWVGSFECPSFSTNPDNADCWMCIKSTEPPVVPVLLATQTTLFIYVQAQACEAVAQNKTHCIEAVEHEFCRVTSCEVCANDPGKFAEYQECVAFADKDACADIVVPADCESLFTQDSPECDSFDVVQRAINTTRVLCGPPP